MRGRGRCEINVEMRYRSGIGCLCMTIEMRRGWAVVIHGCHKRMQITGIESRYVKVEFVLARHEWGCS